MWYTGLLLFRSTHHPDSGDEPLWEETLILVNANSDEQARTLLTKYATSEEHNFLNENGSKVSWEFMKVASVFEIGDVLKEETELFYRFLKDSEVKSIESEI